jgi:hypothetical protein
VHNFPRDAKINSRIVEEPANFAAKWRRLPVFSSIRLSGGLWMGLFAVRAPWRRPVLSTLIGKLKRFPGVSLF